jgi:hypothetical protein
LMCLLGCLNVNRKFGIFFHSHVQNGSGEHAVHTGSEGGKVVDGTKYVNYLVLL